MAEPKPQQISGYDKATTSIIESTCLHLATHLGSFNNEIVIVGGIVPYLLIDQSSKKYDQHCGSHDVDIGLSITLLEEEHYEAIANKLRSAGFNHDEKEKPTMYRWRHKTNTKAVVDFMIDSPGKVSTIQKLSDGLGAFRAPGVNLAFLDKTEIVLNGITLDGAEVKRKVWVCGAGAFLLLKALAFQNRSEPKDAYDIDYIVRNYGSGTKEIADIIIPLLQDPKAQEGLELLKVNFETPNSNGPIKLAMFLDSEDDENLRADSSGLVMQIINLCK